MLANITVIIFAVFLFACSSLELVGEIIRGRYARDWSTPFAARDA
jgi:hypothetical protein